VCVSAETIILIKNIVLDKINKKCVNKKNYIYEKNQNDYIFRLP
jgi:hypothetical protein